MEKEFVVQSYIYCKFAMPYSPNSTKKSASAQPGRWIRQNGKLKIVLLDSGLKKGCKILTPKVVRCIIEVIGKP
jgi:hypothetical protein